MGRERNGIMRIINSNHRARITGRGLSEYALTAGTFEWACKTVVTSNRLVKPSALLAERRRRGCFTSKRDSMSVLPSSSHSFSLALFVSLTMPLVVRSFHAANSR